MAPQIGPKDAPITTKTGMILPAYPVTENRMLTAAPTLTEAAGEIIGSVVLKLLAAMKAGTQAGGNAAAASRNMAHLAVLGSSTTGIKPKESRMKPFLVAPRAMALERISGDP